MALHKIKEENKAIFPTFLSYIEAELSIAITIE